MDKKTFDQLLEETHGCNGHSYPVEDQIEEPENFELTDEMDHEILMHRDAHFAGDFKVMLQYYDENGVGTNPDFDVERITYLQDVEQQLGGNLAALVLSGQETERVAAARAAYRKLKDVYEEGNDLSCLIADLVLTEEEEPEELFQSVIEMGERIIPELLHLINSPTAFDPLFPGYGLAPALAIHCLGELKEERAIVPIFERFGSEMLFDEELLLAALHKIGEPAKRFLLKILKGRPITSDNIHAAFALTAFDNDSKIATAAYEELQIEEVRNKPLLSTYLLCHCDALQGTPHKEAFIAMSKDPSISSAMRLEIENITRNW